MPRVRPLTAQQDQKEINKRGNQTLADLITLYKAHNHKSDADLGTFLGVDNQRVFRLRRSPGSARLEDVRTLAHSMRMTQEDWLRIGGYKV